MDSRDHSAQAPTAGRRLAVGTVAGLLVASLIALVGCSSSGSAAVGPATASDSATSSAIVSQPDPSASGPVVTGWAAATSSPEIAVAQSEFGSVGKTLLTWASATSAVGVTVDYITDYTPAAGFTIPAGQRAIQIDLRIVNAGSQAIDLSGWTVYADINNQPLSAVKDANYLDITELPPVAANSNGYVPARVLIPSAGGTMLIGVTNPSFPNQPATFAVTLS